MWWLGVAMRTPWGTWKPSKSMPSGAVTYESDESAICLSVCLQDFQMICLDMTYHSVHADNADREAHRLFDR